MLDLGNRLRRWRLAGTVCYLLKPNMIAFKSRYGMFTIKLLGSFKTIGPHVCVCLQLSRPPRFRTENKDYQEIRVWKDIEHFADDHPSSTCRFVLVTLT